ncbi:hypothetical protein Cob_v013166 [Colletotrichum orbiculare MAFF 240422]|uniref:Uncharacterized protein n=1 Tax=Colletotrichum orbiculare (strain 104-T / ATCC 96160 / CBS 514.97 / LARS 414 / MAFF 240422) TaxID=1213857 RepID=A0A484F9X0_COLOR|nr:hypothetical protein Cob_v013166 [Colletotrichum orbiculare MAFF 240422]
MSEIPLPLPIVPVHNFNCIIAAKQTRDPVKREKGEQGHQRSVATQVSAGSRGASIHIANPLARSPQVDATSGWSVGDSQRRIVQSRD